MGLFDWLFGNVEVKEEDFSQELKGVQIIPKNNLLFLGIIFLT